MFHQKLISFLNNSGKFFKKYITSQRNISISRKASRTYYDILQVSPSSSNKEIRDAFITLSKKYHPDIDPKMHKEFVKLNEAYSILSKPDTRRGYDLSLSSRYFTSTSKEYENVDYSKLKEHLAPKMDYSNRDYYSIKGLKKKSNNYILTWILMFAALGVVIQVIIMKTAYSRSSKHIQEENRVNSMMHTIAKLKLMELGEEQQFKRFQERISPNEISSDEE